MMFREMHYEGSLWPQVIAAIAVSLGSLSIGFSSGYTSPALVTMLNSTTITVTDEEGSWVGGLLPLAALLGAIVGGPLVDYLGRKRTIIGTAAPFFIGWLFIAIAKTVYLVLLGRTICGLCVGIDSLAIPVYIGEVLHPKVRGALGLFPTAIGNIGILICYTAGMFLNWSYLAHLGALLTVPFFLLMLIIPETPKWYVLHEREEDAKKAMQWLRGKNANIDTEVADMALRDDISSKSSSVKDVFLGKYRKSILITIGLMAFQQLSGVSAVIFYTVQIFKMSGSSIDENLSTIIVGIVNFCSTFVAAFVIDLVGRKILLYVSAITMSLTIIVLGVFFYIRDAHKLNVDHLGWLPLSMVTLYLIGFSMGFGPVPWLMMGEILPAKIRGPAASICTAFNWLCTFVVTKTFHNILHAIGPYGAFWMFGVICFIGLFFVTIWVPETKGKSLEQIENQLTGLKEFVRRISAH